MILSSGWILAKITTVSADQAGVWQNKLQQNFSNGVSFLVAYTWGKSIDGGDVIGTYTAASSSSGLPQNSANLRGDRGLSDFDVRQRVVFSPVVQLPFGAGKKYLQTGWGARLAGDWQVSGIYTYQTGRPFSVFNSSASNSLQLGLAVSSVQLSATSPAQHCSVGCQFSEFLKA